MNAGRAAELKALGQRILQARLELGARQSPPRTITQEEIADAMEVSNASVSAWESGQKGPSRDKLMKLATVLGVRAGWLAFAEEPKRLGEHPVEDQDQRRHA